MFFKKAITGLIKLIIAICILCGLSFWWIGHDISSLNRFCLSVTVGKPIVSLDELAKEYSISQFDKERSVYNQEAKNWLLIVPSKHTMGEFACIITHDGVQVVNSKMNND